MSSKAFCPGHITGFFTVSDEDKSLVETGSRGAGFSIELGAISEIDLGGEGWYIEVNGQHTSFPVVEKTLYNVAPGGKAIIETEVPFSQGFGMSGACALSAGMAALDELGKDPEQAVEMAHISEVFCRTGLGDVIAQSKGGFEIRVKEGLPPVGEIKKIEIEKKLILAIMGPPLVTPDILGDPMMKEWIKIEGNKCMEKYLPNDGFDKFLDLSIEFARNTQFLRDPMDKILNKIDSIGKGSMSMIGNSVFLFGDIDELKSILKKEEIVENVFLTSIDNEGARLI